MKNTYRQFVIGRPNPSAANAGRGMETGKNRSVNGRGERIRTSGPCLPKTVTSSRGYKISTTYALRYRAYVTEVDSDELEWTPFGHIPVTRV